MSAKRNTPNEDAKRETARSHQPGQSTFAAILPLESQGVPKVEMMGTVSEEIDWLVGEPTQAGPYTIRVKVPKRVKLMPHRHPEDRVYTVISGTFYIGLGRVFSGVQKFAGIR
jgi:hypothetical protein